MKTIEFDDIQIIDEGPAPPPDNMGGFLIRDIQAPPRVMNIIPDEIRAAPIRVNRIEALEEQNE